jgi:hypothetical protein
VVDRNLKNGDVLMLPCQMPPLDSPTDFDADSNIHGVGLTFPHLPPCFGSIDNVMIQSVNVTHAMCGARQGPGLMAEQPEFLSFHLLEGLGVPAGSCRGLYVTVKADGGGHAASKPCLDGGRMVRGPAS